VRDLAAVYLFRCLTQCAGVQFDPIPSYITPKNLVGLKALLTDYGLM
jgi:hypothetical protein